MPLATGKSGWTGLGIRCTFILALDLVFALLFHRSNLPLPFGPKLETGTLQSPKNCANGSDRRGTNLTPHINTFTHYEQRYMYICSVIVKCGRPDSGRDYEE